MTLHAHRSRMLFLLAALLLAACSPATPTPIATPSHPAATATTGPTPTITPSPTPPIGVDPAALRGVTIQVWHAFVGAAGDVFTNQVAQFNASNEWGILVTPAGTAITPACTRRSTPPSIPVKECPTWWPPCRNRP